MAAPNAGAKSFGVVTVSRPSITPWAPFRKRLDIKPAGKRRQKPDIGQSREAAADPRVVRKHRDRQSDSQRSRKPLVRLRLRGSVRPRNNSGMRLPSPAARTASMAAII